jgi:ATP-dependent DNA ligase
LIDLPASPYEVRLVRLIERTRSTPNLRNVGCVRSAVIEDRGALERYLSTAKCAGCVGVVLRNPRARYYVGETPTQPFIASYLRFGE